MSKIIKVGSCNGCPYARTDYFFERFMHTRCIASLSVDDCSGDVYFKQITSRDEYLSIPSWCPLEDA